jgi:hypothetical protein
MSDNIVIEFPTDLSAWPDAFTSFQADQVEAASPELAPVVSPSSPTIAPAVPVEFSTPGNQQPGTTARVIW